MAAALKNLASLTGEKKVAIIGDMFELGAESADQHRLIAALVSVLSLDLTIYIGKYFHALKEEFEGEFFLTPDEAKEYLRINRIKDHLILLKGSRGMALEQLLPLL
jgi:UDP-N-acetylmuramoyl-tripeptide--D-alanyl-D-alanine ligase